MKALFLPSLHSLERLIRTLADIPPGQLLHRLAFESRQRIARRISADSRRTLFLRGIGEPPDRRGSYLSALRDDITEIRDAPRRPDSDIVESDPHLFRFAFLGRSREWRIPIDWNPEDETRLWRFQLHYFDWIREELDQLYAGKMRAFQLEERFQTLLNDWIAGNPYFTFDGWHPYTTSLRVVNWTYALSALPGLVDPTIERSLWGQVHHVARNKEYFAGGNHLLENLRAIIVGGCYFDDPNIEQLVVATTNELARELSKQVRSDGFHYEMSTSYHLIVMNIVAECVVALRAADLEVPDRVLEALALMANAARGFRLENGEYPLANDAAYDLAPPLDETLAFVDALLDGSNTGMSGLTSFHSRLLASAKNKSRPVAVSGESNLLDTYHMLRPPAGLEVWVDTAPICPPELPAHGHADALNVDVFFRGQPVLVETGTSRYGSSAERQYERSTRAHNTIEVAGQDQSEVWGSFRVGRKARPFSIDRGQAQGWQWVVASHDGYLRTLGVEHRRWVGVNESVVAVVDRISGGKSGTSASGHFHIAPGVSAQTAGEGAWHLEGSNFQGVLRGVGIDSPELIAAEEADSWYAPRFGEQHFRPLLRYRLLLQDEPLVFGTFLLLGEDRECRLVVSDDGFQVVVEDIPSIAQLW